MNVRLITRYAKAHVALVGAILTWVIATFPGGQTAHYCSLAVGLLTAVGVFAVPNSPPVTSDTDTTDAATTVAYTAPRPVQHVGRPHVTTVAIPEFHSPAGGRLGRHVEHDERSRDFRVRAATQLRSVSWKRHVKPFDQGQIGSCTGNAMAGALSTAPFTHRFGERTAVTLYKAATRLDDVPGTYPPDDTGSSGLAVAKAAQARGWITTYLHCFSVDDVISALQSGPVIAGTNWYTGMDTPDATGHVKVTGTVRGGHEYELVGVDLERQLIHACNSWGPSWGAAGYFTISFADFKRLLSEQGDVTAPRR